MNIQNELVNLFYKTQMSEMNEDEAVYRLGELQIESGLSEKEFMKEISRSIKSVIKEIK